MSQLQYTRKNMVDFKNINEVLKLEPFLKHIGMDLGRAVQEGCKVTIRIEDIPGLRIDSELVTKLTSARIAEETKCLYLDGDNLRLVFKYDTYSQGAESLSFSKFYFQTENVCATIIVDF